MAGAGSGKTTSLCRRILHTLRTGNATLASIHVFSFATTTCVTFQDRFREIACKEGVRDLAPTALNVSTMHAWCRNLLKAVEVETAAMLGFSVQVPLMFDEQVRMARRVLQCMLDLNIPLPGEATATQRTFYVDEAQDLSPEQVGILELLLEFNCKLVFVGDQEQAIYSFQGSSPAGFDHFRQRLGDDGVLHLRSNHRSRRRIIQVANELVAAGEIAEGMLPGYAANRAVDHNGVVEVRPYRTDREIVEFVRHLRNVTDSAKTIAILVHTNARAEQMHQCLLSNQQHSWRVMPVQSKPRPEEQEASILVCTIHNAKGTEFDIVLVLDVEDQGLERETMADCESRRKYYVATTRGKEIVVYLIREDKGSSICRHLRRIQSWSVHPREYKLDFASEENSRTQPLAPALSFIVAQDVLQQERSQRSFVTVQEPSWRAPIDDYYTADVDDQILLEGFPVPRDIERFGLDQYYILFLTYLSYFAISPAVGVQSVKSILELADRIPLAQQDKYYGSSVLPPNPVDFKFGRRLQQLLDPRVYDKNTSLLERTQTSLRTDLHHKLSAFMRRLATQSPETSSELDTAQKLTTDQRMRLRQRLHGSPEATPNACYRWETIWEAAERQQGAFSQACFMSKMRDAAWEALRVQESQEDLVRMIWENHAEESLREPIEKLTVLLHQVVTLHLALVEGNAEVLLRQIADVGSGNFASYKGLCPAYQDVFRFLQAFSPIRFYLGELVQPWLKQDLLQCTETCRILTAPYLEGTAATLEISKEAVNGQGKGDSIFSAFFNATARSASGTTKPAYTLDVRAGTLSYIRPGDAEVLRALTP